MGSRTVRLDKESEKVLAEIRKISGLSISAVFKAGLLSFRKDIARTTSTTPYELYEQLELGPGGYATAPSSQVKLGVKRSIERKLRP